MGPNPEQTREDVDYAEIFTLSDRIRNSANEAADLSKRLQQEDLSDEERDTLALALSEAVKRGHELSEERMRLFAQMSA